MKILVSVLCLLSITVLIGQKESSSQLLDDAIAFHDPDGLWSKFKGELFVTLEYPDGRKRESIITLDNSKSYFKLAMESDSATIISEVKAGKCSFMLNGITPTKSQEAKYNLKCERATKMKDYYSYLYGLPMKLKDPGTIIAPEVLSKNFKGKKYNVLKVTYTKDVGDDIWYFYFDPKTNAMEVYQFYHDESKNDGEYIILEGIESISSIKMPKVRTWYYNKNDELLGTDILMK
ncbi:DUF6503 family protein [Eudoraea chungangensis]|uniref:DUF6503 family protein n=1 Tax=Eudoraea chungangensis TaxID=1481905 RepID=UPI0023ECDB58|nr:DUF6503 family protein [Eudoraea chungangensis]